MALPTKFGSENHVKFALDFWALFSNIRVGVAKAEGGIRVAGGTVDSPPADASGPQEMSPKDLARLLRNFKKDAGAAAYPGAEPGLNPNEIDELARLVGENFSEAGAIQRHKVPYGRDVRQVLGGEPWDTCKIAVLLEGVVEVQAPFESSHTISAARAGVYPVTVLRPPALIWLFEAIPQSGIREHQVEIKAGVQSFVVFLLLSQLKPWQQIASRGSTDIDHYQLNPDDTQKHTELFKWAKDEKAPGFDTIARPRQPTWHLDLAVLDVDAIFRTPHKDLKPKQRELRDALYRTAVRQFGHSLRRHVPGYRVVRALPLHRQARRAVEIEQSIVPFIHELRSGDQPHHTCCLNYQRAAKLFPVKTLTWNIYDYVRRAGNQPINKRIESFGDVKTNIAEELDEAVAIKFFDECLRHFVFVPSFSEADDVCLYSPALWPHDDKNALLRAFDPRHAGDVLDQYNKTNEDKTMSLTDFHIGTVPEYFKANQNRDGVPPSIADLIMTNENGVFFRKRRS